MSLLPWGEGADCPGMPRRIAVLIYPGVQPLDAVGPLEVFSTAARCVQARGEDSPYQLLLLGLQAGPQTGASGYALVAHKSYREVRDLGETP